VCSSDLYAPVCARHGKAVRSWDNAACARFYGGRVLHAGRFRKDIETRAVDPHDGSRCSADGERPVCAELGATRMTFPSVCHAVAVGATVVTWGACWY
jgi:hypothetical protein